MNAFSFQMVEERNSFPLVLVGHFQVLRAGLNVEIASDLIANQLNVRNGALVLLVKP